MAGTSGQRFGAVLHAAVSRLTTAIVLRCLDGGEEGEDAHLGQPLLEEVGDEGRAVVRLDDQRRAELEDQGPQRVDHGAGGLGLDRQPGELEAAGQVADGQHLRIEAIDGLRRLGVVQMVVAPSLSPIGQGAWSQAELGSGLGVSQSRAGCPAVVGHGAAAHGAFGLASRALKGPAALRARHGLSRLAARRIPAVRPAQCRSDGRFFHGCRSAGCHGVQRSGSGFKEARRNAGVSGDREEAICL